MKIVDFLDGISLSEERVLELTKNTTFSYMKEHQEQFMPISVPWKEGYSFIRNGTVGDSSNYFTDADNIVFEEMVNRKFPNGIPTWLRELNVL